MQAIIPLAGKGTRVRPHTHSRPKPLLRVANRPVLSHVIDQLREVGVEEAICITGHLADQIEAFMDREYPDLGRRYIPQEEQLGTADAIRLAEPYVNGPVLIVFVDTLFDADFGVIERRPDDDGFIWAKEVEDYQRFGVIVTDGDGYMKRIVEKPSEPISKLANIGLYYIRDHERMFDGIHEVMASGTHLGEYFLTDAFQYMIDRGARLYTAEVSGWWDCGKPETLLETNRVLLERGQARRPEGGRARVTDPVHVAPGVVLEEVEIGPNVSIAEGTTVRRSRLGDCIVGAGTTLEDCDLHDSLVGDEVTLVGVRGRVNVGDHSEVRADAGRSARPREAVRVTSAGGDVEPNESNDLIYDWNRLPGSFDYSAVRVELDDETLRDGLQNPSVLDPPVDRKRELLHIMAELGIHAADIGLPGAGPRAYEAVLELAREIAREKLPIAANCAARTVRADIAPIADVAQKTGLRLEVGAFIGSSPIRRYAEGWEPDMVRKATRDAVSFAVSEGLDVMYVTEDTTRSRPETLRELYLSAIESGARRICLADTVGHATPHGTRQLVRFARELVEESGEEVKVDWHGHRDRGFGLANTLAAIEEGVDRVHGTALGIGERVGNVEMDLLLVNLKLLGMHDVDLSALPRYCRLTADMCGVEIPHSYPVMGSDAFRTGTGVHASAIIKAIRKGDRWLEDRVYSGVPASEFGLRQVIEISPVSGLSNVRYWLGEHGYDPEDEGLCDAVFALAKRSDHVLTREEIEAEISRVRPGARNGSGSEGLRGSG